MPQPATRDEPAPLSPALLLAGGAVLALAAGLAHPAREDPSDHARVFHEYADSQAWIVLHLAQFAGYALAYLGLIAALSARARARRPGATAAGLAAALATASIAIYAVVQGVDAIVLKWAVDRWVAASPAEAATAFAIAEAVRVVEIGVNCAYRLVQGAAFLTAGAALWHGTGATRALGAAGIVLGTAILARGLAVAATGFALSNPIYAATGLFASNVPPLLILWLLALAWTCWQDSRPP